MSSLEYVSENKVKQKPIQKYVTDLDLSSDIDFKFNTFNYFFHWVLESLTSEKPVNVVGDTIKIKEHLLQEDMPYAFRYQGKDYLVTKKEGKTKLFEIK